MPPLSRPLGCETLNGMGRDISGCIACAVGDSTTGSKAASVAARLARDLDRPALLVHISEQGRSPLGHVPHARRVRREVRSTAAVHAFPKGTEVRLEAGDPAEVLIAVAADADAELLVVPSHVASDPSGDGLDDFVARLIREAPCPVVVVPHACNEPLDPGSLQPVVCGVADERSDRAALALAADLASRLGGVLYAVIAYDPSATRPPASSSEQDPRRAAEQALKRALEQGDIEAWASTLPLPPSEALTRVAEAERAGLIVTGSPRDRGSVASRLAAEGRTAIVVLPHHARSGAGGGHHETTVGTA